MPRILVVEDNTSLRSLIAILLQRQGFDVVQAENGMIAWHKLQRDAHFDAIVSDLCMPEMDGLHLIALVRERHPRIPVIVASAYMYQLKSAITQGAARYLLKPFSNGQLIDTVRATLLTPATNAS